MVPEYAEHVDEDQGDEYDECGENGLQVPVHLPTQQHCKNTIFNKVKKYYDNLRRRGRRHRTIPPKK
jgi:hypothetical protein